MSVDAHSVGSERFPWQCPNCGSSNVNVTDITYPPYRHCRDCHHQGYPEKWFVAAADMTQPPNGHDAGKAAEQSSAEQLPKQEGEQSRAEPPRNRNLDAALGLAAAGLRIFPVHVYLDKQKRKWEKVPRKGISWPSAATTNPNQIREWWKQWPGSCPGIALEHADLVVIDTDRHAGTADGVTAFGELVAKYKELGPHPVSQTAGNGEHHFFKQMPGVKLGNSDAALPGGINVRGLGGFVVAPGSRRVDGKEWSAPGFVKAYKAGDIPIIPDWLFGLLKPPEQEHQSKTNGSTRGAAGSEAPLDELANVKSALPFIPADDRNKNWFKVGAALHSTAWGCARELFDEWSKTCVAKFDVAGQDKLWKSFDRPRKGKPITIATLFDLAMKHGWKHPGLAGTQDKPEIRVIPGLIHRTATQAEAALIAGGAPFYSRGGQIVRPIVEEVMATRGFKTLVTRAKPVSPDSMVDHMARASQFVRFDGRSDKFVPIDPPKAVAATVLSRDGEWKFPALAGLLTTQTLRPDGTILAVPGYDPATRLLLLAPPRLPPIPDKPTRADAETALALLAELLREFPFADAESRAVALSGLITPVVRGAMVVAPLHGLSAPAAGTGKSYLVDLCSAIATGQRSAGITAGRDEAETEKRLVGVAMTADQIISIDNHNGELGGDFLCQLVERPVATARMLGGNSIEHMRRIENRSTVFANGNNLTPRADVIRRTLLGSLDADLEKPYQREFKHNPLNLIFADRGKYIAACLTIARAYLIANELVKLAPLVSYEDWCQVVREPLVWLGEADPVKTIDTASDEDPELVLLTAVMTELRKLVRDDKMTVGEIKDAANEREDEPSGFDGGRYGRQPTYRRPELRQALLDAAGMRGEIDGRRLGCFLKRYKGRIVGGNQDRKRKQQIWGVKQR